MDTSHPGVSLSSYLPQGRRQIRAGAASLRDSFHPQAAPTVSRSPLHPHVEVSSMLLSIPLFFHALLWVLFNHMHRSMYYLHVEFAIHKKEKITFLSQLLLVSQSPNCSQNPTSVKSGYGSCYHCRIYLYVFIDYRD